jgi:alcohol dehydrogenase
MASTPTENDSQGIGTLPAFDFQPRTRVVFGGGKISQLGELCRELGGTRVLLVTDRGLGEAGHPQKGIGSLERAGLQVAVFDDVNPNPTTADVDRGLAMARSARIDLLVGLGGGSSMDCAKGINFLLTNGGRMEDYWGVGKATQPMLPLVAVPTTSGTGSEAQSFALIAQEESHLKMACGDPKAACRIALLDPELTLSMPTFVTGATGIDAISHAVESYVTNRRNPVSQLFSRQAWQLLAPAFSLVVREPRNFDARSRMLLGAHLAGAAIENSMLGATHALANPLSANFNLTHGVAIAIMLPHVLRFNAPVAGRWYADLLHDLTPGHSNGIGPEQASEQLAEHLSRIAAEAGLPQRLRDCQVTAESLPALAAEAAQQWTCQFNPRPVDATVLEGLYRCAW